MISCEDYDKVFQGVEDGAIVGIGGASIDMLEGTIGDHENCPKDALEAYWLIQSKLVFIILNFSQKSLKVLKASSYITK